MARKVGYDGLRQLEVGNRLQYKAGHGDHRVEASATVARTPGSTGVFIQLGDIRVRGSKTDVKQGQEVLAGANELFR